MQVAIRLSLCAMRLAEEDGWGRLQHACEDESGSENGWLDGCLCSAMSVHSTDGPCV